MRKRIFSLLFSVLSIFSLKGQNPTTWDVSSELIENNTYAVSITAEIEEGWHLYSQYLNLGDHDGPLSTYITFENNSYFELIDSTSEVGVETHFDPVWGIDISYFGNSATFIQKVKVLNSDSTLFKGNVNFMVCDEKACLPPDNYSFEIDLKMGIGGQKKVIYKTDSSTLAIIPDLPLLNLNEPINKCGKAVEKGDKGYLWLFGIGLLGGLIALFTPCVFPMIPLTVSFFTKGGQDRLAGVMKALLYGFSIIFIYAFFGWIVGIFFSHDPEVLNRISTGFWLNFIFFVLFVVFAISFFGYFEITLPSSWANKADSAADIGGLIGIFFMALVLVIVSFSCTGPILGSVLVNALSQGPGQLIVTMAGFGLGLGLPFTLLAMFPILLKSLPSSGGWLNTFKVTLGFIEIALAVKFLSNADYVYQFEIVLRETFFLIWIIVSILTFAYLMGKIIFPHDTKGAKISMTRKLISIPFLLFAIYLLPGVMPENQQPWTTSIISGFPPAMNYSWYDQENHHFLDFDEACAEAERLNKPILIDFTGYACVNCRKMEENVWNDPEVANLMENYVVVSLYVDNKNKLPEEQQGEITITMADGTKKQKKIISMGDKESSFEAFKFGKVSQPYYVLLKSCKGELLTTPIAYTPDQTEYAKWLQCGIDAFNKIK